MSIRDFLTNLVATFSGPRYRPEIEWSDKSWTHNFFRCFEWMFGRKYGIRIESSLRVFTRNNCYYDTEVTIYTFEALCAHIEAYIRNFFTAASLKRVFAHDPRLGMPKPVFLTLVIFGAKFSALLDPSFVVPLVGGAIAYDQSGEGTTCNVGGGGLSYSSTTSGSDRLLIGGCGLGNAGAADTTFTYGAGSLTNIANLNDGNYFGTFGYLIAPTTGSNTVSFSGGSLGERISVVLNYTGVGQTTQPDSSNTGSDTSGSFVLATTVVAAGCWLVGAFGGNGTSDYTAGTATTHRNSSTCGNSGYRYGMLDSNGTVGTGSQSLEITDAANNTRGAIASIAPPASATKFLGLLGIGA